MPYSDVTFVEFYKHQIYVLVSPKNMDIVM